MGAGRTTEGKRKDNRGKDTTPTLVLPPQGGGDVVS